MTDDLTDVVTNCQFPVPFSLFPEKFIFYSENQQKTLNISP